MRLFLLEMLRSARQTITHCRFRGHSFIWPQLTTCSIGTLIAAKDGLPFERRDHRGSKQPSIQQDALNSLYLKQYAQLIKKPHPDTHRFQVRTSCDVVGASCVESSKQLVLELLDQQTGSKELSKPVDFLFVASGYDRKFQENLLEPLGGLGDRRDGHISVDGEYRVNFRRDVVAPTAAIWVLDAFEGASDDAFSYMAVRTRKIVNSLLETQKLKDERKAAAAHVYEERAVL
jgi:lysine/ornithine N-monooxygenase